VRGRERGMLPAKIDFEIQSLCGKIIRQPKHTFPEYDFCACHHGMIGFRWDAVVWALGAARRATDGETENYRRGRRSSKLRTLGKIIAGTDLGTLGKKSVDSAAIRVFLG